MPLSADEMEALTTRLMRQQDEIFARLGFDARPHRRPPARPDTLAALEASLRASGRWLPPSYATFLQLCDGIEDFSVSYTLLGARDILDASYEARSAEVLAGGIGYAFRPELPPLLVGDDPETPTRVFLDFHHEPLVEGEPVVLDGNPGDLTLHESFEAFLQHHVRANELTIAQLEQLRQNGDG